LHCNWADKEGILSPYAVKLAIICTEVVDASKCGTIIPFNEAQWEIDSVPAWIQQKNKHSIKIRDSVRILGLLHKNWDQILDKQCITPKFRVELDSDIVLYGKK